MLSTVSLTKATLKLPAIFTAQKIKFSITDFFRKCDQIRTFLQIWSHLLKKSVIENFIFCAMFSLQPLCPFLKIRVMLASFSIDRID